MRFNPRPAKVFFYNKLEKELKKRIGGIGIDVASAGIKFSSMFHTDDYYGFDIDINSLKNAFENNVDIKKKGIWGDMKVDVKKLPSCSIDLVVSTNTLYIFSPEERLSIIKDLIEVVAPSGDFLIEMKKDKNVEKIYNILKNNFVSIKKIYYKNMLSNFYERLLDKTGNIRRNKYALSKSCLLLSWLLSWFEYLTSHFSFLNKHIFFVCNKKQTNCTRRDFDLSQFPIIGKSIFDLMTR